MTKEEFIGYLAALEDMVDDKAQLKLIKKIKARAETINVYAYTYRNYPYYPNIWYGASSTGDLGNITLTSKDSAGNVTLPASTGWSVSTLPNGDFEIKK